MVRSSKYLAAALAAAAPITALFILSASSPIVGQSNDDGRDGRRRIRFTRASPFESEQRSGHPPAPTEAPAGFTNRTNGFSPQGQAFETLNEGNAVAGRSFNDNRFIFEEVETVADGLGPTYNAQSCRECHQNIVTGGASQVTVLRTGHLTRGQFFESQGGSLIQSRAIHPDITEMVVPGDDIRAFRISPNTLGDGFIEAIANDTLVAIRDGQPGGMRGTAVQVPVLEASGHARIGRFGWKGQHASLQSFAADAYLNEMGITSPLLPEENTASGRNVKDYDTVADPEDDGDDLAAFADFMRSTLAPPRGSITADVTAGAQLFERIGCVTCHVASITTAETGTVINGGAMTVPEALGNKIIHPYSDFLLHDINSGDGIPIQPTDEYAGTANQIKTAPLWALRTRNRLMHDGLSLTREEAIQRHGGQAAGVTRAYRGLGNRDQARLLAFLDSL